MHSIPPPPKNSGLPCCILEDTCPIRCLLPLFDDERGLWGCKTLFKLVIHHLIQLVLGGTT